MIREFCEKQEKSAVIGGLDDKEYAGPIKQLDSSEVNVKKKKVKNILRIKGLQTMIIITVHFKGLSNIYLKLAKESPLYWNKFLNQT